VGLKEELGLKQPFTVPAHEALLSIFYTGSMIKKRAREFFSKYGITDVQFNLMMLLMFHSGDDGGLTQADLSRMMLVNRANITSLIDRMEKANLVMRTPVQGDRRYNCVRLTAYGKRLLVEVEEEYAHEVGKIMGVLDDSDVQELISALERLRANLNEL
jgi:MarR family 2-MHQ and catechol resistance regulon transcriptional repressor